MRRCMAIARSFLFLSIVRSALAAPVVVRRVHEVHVNGAEDRAVTSRMLWEPWVNRLTDAADRPTDHSPAPAPNPDHPQPLPRTLTPGYSVANSPLADKPYSPSSWSTDSSPSSWSTDETYSPSSWSTDPLPSPITGYSTPNSWLADDSHLPSSWSPKFSPSSSWSPNLSPPSSWPQFSPPTDHSPSPAPNPDHLPPSDPDHPLTSPLTSAPGYSAPNSPLADKPYSLSSWSTDSSSSSWSTDKTYSPSSWLTDPLPAPNSWLADESHLPSSWWPKLSPPSWLSSDNSHSASPGHSSDSSPSTVPHQSTDDPPPNPELSLANPAESVSKPESEDFLDMLLKGKIRRRISGPGAVNSV